MQVSKVGLDIAKNVLQVHRIDGEGLGQAVLDVVGSADLVEAVRAVAGGPARAVSGQIPP